ncbi:MAG TPA: response regulator transcription factor [Vicinamibacterales bacterium]|nr:response regulator transcription factor [Vicinamibacterales bacterium]
MISVLLVDDHPVVHEGVQAALARTPDIRLVRAVDTVEAAVTAMSEVRPDVVLLDVRLGREDGLTAIGTLIAVHPHVRILVFSAYDVDAYVLGALRAGARGYALKGAPGAELVAAIRRVHEGESYVSPSLSAKLVDQIQARSRGSRLLTPRELMVLQLMATGLSNRDIASSLEISERTVKFHVTAILNKLGADNRTQAVAMAGRRGMLSDDAMTK